MMNRVGGMTSIATPVTFGKRYQSKSEDKKSEKDPLGSAPESAGFSLASATILSANGAHNLDEPIGKALIGIGSLQVALSTAMYAESLRAKKKPTDPEPVEELPTAEPISESEPIPAPEPKSVDVKA